MSPEERQEVMDKEKLILDAAMDEFVAEGWGGARMQSIADRAGINKTLLHYYFRSKEKLYEKVIYNLAGFFFGVLFGTVNEKDDLEDFVKSFISTLIDNAAANPRIPLFLMQELGRGGQSVRRILGEILQKQKVPVPEIMLAKIQTAIGAGRIRPINPIQFILSLLGACLYFFMAEPIIMEIGTLAGQMQNFDRKTFLEERKQAIFDQFFYGIKRRQEQ